MPVKCKICGVEKEFSIVEHLKYEHKITSKEYKERFPNSNVKSVEFSKMNSTTMKVKWSDTKFKDKMKISRKISHNKPEFVKKMSEIIKNKHKENPELFTGFTQWHKTEKFKEWVVSEERISKISETSKKRWENDEYKLKTINSIKKSLNDGRCGKSIEFREKMSIIISKLYSDGTISNESNRYKSGKYTSKKNEEFFYSSSYELEAMKLFDESHNINNWTNKHNIRIKYYYNNLNRHYVPDFLIKFNNGDEYIIEMKGWETEEVLIKQEYTLKQYPNYKLFYSVNDLKKFIYENK